MAARLHVHGRRLDHPVASLVSGRGGDRGGRHPRPGTPARCRPGAVSQRRACRGRAGSVSSSRHDAQSRLGAGRPDHLPVPRAALRRGRTLHLDPLAAGRADLRPPVAQRAAVGGTLRIDLDHPGRPRRRGGRRAAAALRRVGSARLPVRGLRARGHCRLVRPANRGVPGRGAFRLGPHRHLR